MRNLVIPAIFGFVNGENVLPPSRDAGEALAAHVTKAINQMASPKGNNSNVVVMF